MTFLMPLQTFGRVEANYIGGVTSSAVNNSVSGSFNFGAEDENRIILVGAYAGIGVSPPSTVSLSGVTIAGNSSTIIYSTSGGPSNSNAFGIAIANIPAGTSGTIAAGFTASGSISVANKAIVAYSIYNSRGVSNTIVLGGSIGSPPGGAIIGLSALFGSTGTLVWTGVSKDGQSGNLTGGSLSAEDELAPFTVTCNGTVGRVYLFEAG